MGAHSLRIDWAMTMNKKTRLKQYRNCTVKRSIAKADGTDKSRQVEMTKINSCFNS